MPRNMFDELNGYYDDGDQLDGFLSKLNKKRKKLSRKIRKNVKKVAPKPLKKMIERKEKLGRKLDEKGITKIAAGVALAFVGAPLLMAGVGAAGSAAAAAGGAIKTGVGALAKSALASGVVKQGTSMFIKTKIADKQQSNAAKAEQQMIDQQTVRQVEIEKQLATAMGQSPQFKQVVAQARAQGYSDEQILQHWVESKTYYETAVEEVAKTVQPQIYSEARKQGFSQEYSQDLSEVESLNMAEKTVKETQQKYSGGNLMIPLGIAGLTLLMK